MKCPKSTRDCAHANFNLTDTVFVKVTGIDYLDTRMTLSRSCDDLHDDLLPIEFSV